MSEPEFSFGQGRSQIKLKGQDAIRAAGWAIRVAFGESCPGFNTDRATEQRIRLAASVERVAHHLRDLV